MIDSLLMGVIEASLATPPSAPADGAAYRLLSGADDDWTGHDGEIALRIGGSWNFISPTEGMSVFDKNARVQLHYDSGWATASIPTQPTGGTTVDAEARTAISEIVDTLKTAGILPTSA